MATEPFGTERSSRQIAPLLFIHSTACRGTATKHWQWLWAWLAPPRLARLVRGVGGAHQSGLLYGGAAAACAVAAGSLYYSDHLERSQNNTLSEELNASEKRLYQTRKEQAEATVAHDAEPIWRGKRSTVQVPPWQR